MGGHDQREPGADAGHRHPGRQDRVLEVCRGGRSGPRSWVGSRAPGSFAFSTDGTVRCWPTSPPPRCTRTPRCTTGRWPPPADLADRRRRRSWPAAGPADCGADLLALLTDPSWVYRQYDHQLFLNTVVAPGGDAALLRLAARRSGPGRGPIGAWPCRPTATPGGVRSTPGLGPRSVVAESALNVACVGARPSRSSTASTSATPSIPK